jgi:hypothetical protein
MPLKTLGPIGPRAVGERVNAAPRNVAIHRANRILHSAPCKRLQRRAAGADNIVAIQRHVPAIAAEHGTNSIL